MFSIFIHLVTPRYCSGGIFHAHWLHEVILHNVIGGAAGYRPRVHTVTNRLSTGIVCYVVYQPPRSPTNKCTKIVV